MHGLILWPITFSPSIMEHEKMTHSPSFSIFTFLVCLSVLLQTSLANDTLAPNQTISDGESLVSQNQRFVLGFFSPGKSKNKYIGIWYKATPDIVLWTANRNNPLLDSQGVLTLTGNGTLVLLNSSHGVAWSSNSSRVADSPLLQLLDDGNLVLHAENGMGRSNYIWQSFDYLTDTRLPGMEMGDNVETGREQYLTSWRSADDPSPGSFIYRIDQLGLSQLVIINGTRKLFRTGPWNGLCFNGLLLLGNQSFHGTTDLVSMRVITVFDPYNASAITRLTLRPSGLVERYDFDERKNDWHLTYTLPQNPCDDYAKCGPNTVCNTDKAPICRCLTGFTPKSQQEWGAHDWKNGCMRNVSSDCQNGVTFIEVSGVRMPDLLQFQLKRSMTISECEAECLKNCSCTAYTNPYVNTQNPGCLMWYGDLVDIRQFPEEINEQNIYIRVPVSKPAAESIGGSDKKKKRPAKIIWISTALGILILGLVCGCIVLKITIKRRELRRKKKDIELPLYDFATIAAATNNFSQANKIGEGGFGPVYKGKLSKEQEVAVKRLSKSSGQGTEEFKNEVSLIAKLQHRNLVRLFGCCIHGDERMLIYEFMQNNSLNHFIFDQSRRAQLTWPKRFEIVMGIARGLLYLHQDSRLKIIHRDLKTSNILLDSNLFPKISDFGLARIFGGNEAFAKTKRVIGTYGYMAPEYAIDGKFSVKSDVFSMGVLILEIVSGKRNRNFTHPDHHHNLLGHVWLLWKNNRALEVMDSCLGDSVVVSQVKRSIQVGLLCVQKLAEDRPAMSSVVFMLGNEEANLPQPKQPGFFTERSISHDDMSTSGSEDFTPDTTLTITDMEAR